MRALLLAFVLSACAGHDYRPVTPLQRDLVSRYLAGESLDTLAKETSGDRAAAYELVRDGMLTLQRQLQRDHLQ